MADEPTPPDVALQHKYQRYALCFSGENGRWVLDDLRRLCWWGKSTVKHSSTGTVDVETMLMREGQRNIVLAIEDFITKANLPPRRQRRAKSRLQEPSA